MKVKQSATACSGLSGSKRVRPRTAVCLYGLVGQQKTWKDGGYVEVDDTKVLVEVASRWKSLLKYDGEIDFFIHSWDVGFHDDIKNLYLPKIIKTEPQVQFNVWPRLFREFVNLKGIRRKIRFLANIYFSFPKQKQLFWKKRTFAAMSRWYSTSSSLLMCAEYAKSHNFDYDYVVSARLDLVLLHDLNISQLDRNKLNLAYFNKTPNAALGVEADRSNITEKENKVSDLIFIGNMETMSSLMDIYENFQEYSINPHVAAYQAFNKVISRENFHFYIYPWIEFSTVKNYFFDWKLGLK